MIKRFFLRYIPVLAFAASLLTACGTEEPAMQDSGKADAVIEAKIAVAATRASAEAMPVRCIVEVYNADGTIYEGTGARQELQLDADGNSTAFSASVVSGREYRLVFWADYGDGTYTDNSLRDVRLRDFPAVEGATFPAAYTEADAYTATVNVVASPGKNPATAVSLRRATCHVTLSESEAASGATADFRIPGYTRFDAFEGEASAPVAAFRQVSGTMGADRAGFLTVAILSPQDGEAELSYKPQASAEWKTAGIRLKRNYKVSVTGSFYN